MADTIHDFGTVAFAASMSAMAVCAGVAALPPERNTRVFIGASVLVVAWLIVLAAITYTGSRLVTSGLVALDLFYALIFYQLSRPNPRHPPQEVNWASYVVVIFVAIILLELTHLCFRYPSSHLYPALAVIVILGFLIALGFWRGFGVRPMLVFVAILVAIAGSAVFSYVRIVNFLTLLIILTITVAAGKSAWRNVRARRGKSPSRQA